MTTADDDDGFDVGPHSLFFAFRRKTSTPEVIRLRAQLQTARATIAALADRCTTLQDANEAHYRADYQATGGPRFDTEQPFGTLPRRPLGTLPIAMGAYVARMTGGTQ